MKKYLNSIWILGNLTYDNFVILRRDLVHAKYRIDTNDELTDAILQWTKIINIYVFHSIFEIYKNYYNTLKILNNIPPSSLEYPSNIDTSSDQEKFDIISNFLLSDIYIDTLFVKGNKNAIDLLYQYSKNIYWWNLLETLNVFRRITEANQDIFNENDDKRKLRYKLLPSNFTWKYDMFWLILNNTDKVQHFSHSTYYAFWWKQYWWDYLWIMIPELLWQIVEIQQALSQNDSLRYDVNDIDANRLWITFWILLSDDNSILPSNIINNISNNEE